MSIFLSLGSNLGDRRFYLNSCCDEIIKSGINILKRSPIYESSAMYNEQQPDFFNQVIQIKVESTPLELLKIIKSIEIKLGRLNGLIRYQPRIIDIDLLAMHELIHNSDKLIIPHSLIAERKFVLLPWSNIAPDFIVPLHDKSVIKLLSETNDQSELTLIKNKEMSF